MFRKSKTFLLCAVLLVIGCAASAFFITRASTQTPALITQTGALQLPTTRRPRNLSLRPEVIRVSRRLGNRFAPSHYDPSVLGGVLLIGNTQKTLSITRNQTDTGETVQIELTTEPGILTWNKAEGAKSSISALSEAQRLLIERLVFDSADYFVLAQLRGASYYTLARNLRSDEAGGSDDYNGPLWDVVRIDDPEKDVQKKSISPWRLFYINSNTGLIEKIVSEQGGERIETLFSDWTIVAGERVPARVTWKTGTQTLMEFSLTSFNRVFR